MPSFKKPTVNGDPRSTETIGVQPRSICRLDNAADLQNPDRSSRDGTDNSGSQSAYQHGRTRTPLTPLYCNNDNALNINGVDHAKPTGHISTRVVYGVSPTTSEVLIKERQRDYWGKLCSRPPRSLAKAIARTMGLDAVAKMLRFQPAVRQY